METLEECGATDHEFVDDAGTGLLDALFSNSHDAMVTVDGIGTIVYATSAVASALGFDSASLVGDSVFDFLHPDDLEAAADLFVRRLGFDGADQGKEVRLRSSSGAWTTVVATASLLPDPRFGACAITMTAIDTTDSAAREMSLRRRIVVAEYLNRLGADLMAATDSAAVVDRIHGALGEVALLAAAESAAVYIERRERGVVDLLADCHSSAGPGPFAIDLRGFENSVETLLTRHVAVDHLADPPAGHRDHCLRELTESDEAIALLATPLSSGGRRGTLVLVRRGRGPGWWESDSELVLGTANLFSRALQATWSEALLALTYQLGPVGFSIRTFEGMFVDCNQRYLDLFGFTRDQAATTSLFDMLLPEYHESVRKLYERVIAGELDRFVLEVEAVRGDGSHMWARANVVPMTVPGSTERFALTSLENITEIQQQRIELEHAASHDSLTGVANRAAMCRTIEHHLATTGTLPGLLMIDLDEFKMINDSQGHAAGDHVLKTVAERIAGVLRDSGVVARLGGDEFAVIAPNLSAVDVDGLVERIRRAVDRPIEFGEQSIIQTLSIGIALGDHGSDLADLLVKADRALYAAKHAGRNCHRTFDETMIHHAAT